MSLKPKADRKERPMTDTIHPEAEAAYAELDCSALLDDGGYPKRLAATIIDTHIRRALASKDEEVEKYRKAAEGTHEIFVRFRTGWEGLEARVKAENARLQGELEAERGSKAEHIGRHQLECERWSEQVQELENEARLTREALEAGHE